MQNRPVFCVPLSGKFLPFAVLPSFSPVPFAFHIPPFSTSFDPLADHPFSLPQILNGFLTFSTEFSTVFRSLFVLLHFCTKIIPAFPGALSLLFPLIMRIFKDLNKSTAPTTITILFILSFLLFWMKEEDGWKGKRLNYLAERSTVPCRTKRMAGIFVPYSF